MAEEINAKPKKAKKARVKKTKKETEKTTSFKQYVDSYKVNKGLVASTLQELRKAGRLDDVNKPNTEKAWEKLLDEQSKRIYK